MTTLREAAQQALELLGAWEKPPARLYRVMDNLRAALAQPDDWTRCHHCGQTMPPVPLGQGGDK